MEISNKVHISSTTVDRARIDILRLECIRVVESVREQWEKIYNPDGIFEISVRFISDDSSTRV